MSVQLPSNSLAVVCSQQIEGRNWQVSEATIDGQTNR